MSTAVDNGTNMKTNSFFHSWKCYITDNDGLGDGEGQEECARDM